MTWLDNSIQIFLLKTIKSPFMTTSFRKKTKANINREKHSYKSRSSKQWKQWKTFFSFPHYFSVSVKLLLLFLVSTTFYLFNPLLQNIPHWDFVFNASVQPIPCVGTGFYLISFLEEKREKLLLPHPRSLKPIPSHCSKLQIKWFFKIHLHFY